KPKRAAIQPDRVRFVGETVAFVLAESLEQAKDAADLIEVDYEELPSVTATAKALAPDAPVLWPDNGSNLAVHWEYGEQAEIEAALKKAAKRVTVEIVNNRVIPSPMEPRAAVAMFDKDSERYTLY